MQRRCCLAGLKDPHLEACHVDAVQTRAISDEVADLCGIFGMDGQERHTASRQLIVDVLRAIAPLLAAFAVRTEAATGEDEQLPPKAGHVRLEIEAPAVRRLVRRERS